MADDSNKTNPDDVNEMELDDSKIPAIDLDTLAGESEVELPVSAQEAISTDDFITQFIATAKEYIGVSRATDLPQVAKFLELFNLPTKMDGAWVPFCAAGASYSAAKAYCLIAKIPFTAENSVSVFRKVLPIIRDRWFLPSPSCWQMKQAAEVKGTWQAKGQTPSHGWLVLYNWLGGSTPDHVGILLTHTDSELHDLEFNTSGVAGGSQRNGGVVAIKDRPYTHVVGYAKIV